MNKIQHAYFFQRTVMVILNPNHTKPIPASRISHCIRLKQKLHTVPDWSVTFSGQSTHRVSTWIPQSLWELFGTSQFTLVLKMAFYLRSSNISLCNLTCKKILLFYLGRRRGGLPEVTVVFAHNKTNRRFMKLSLKQIYHVVELVFL